MMKRAFSNKATTRLALGLTTAGAPDTVRTLRWASSFCLPRPRAAPSLIARCICRRTGRHTRSDAAQVGVPQEVQFATKPQLARRMIERALDSGLPVGWVGGDEVYGTDSALRVAPRAAPATRRPDD